MPAPRPITNWLVHWTSLLLLLLGGANLSAQQGSDRNSASAPVVPGATLAPPRAITPATLGPPATAQPSALTPEQVEKIVQDAIRAHEEKKGEAKEKPPAPTTASTLVESIAFPALWRNGLQFESADKAFRLHIGGLIHVDSAFWNAGYPIQYGPGGVGPLSDGANFRRARWHTNGSMYDTVDWALEVGFENRLPQFFNVYVELPQLPYVGNLRVGHFREPFGLDALTSYNNLTFLERGLPLEPFVPFFNLGAMVSRSVLDQRLTYFAGIFRSNSETFNASDIGDGKYAYTTRLVLNPWYEEGFAALHLGGAYSYRVLSQLNSQGLSVAAGGMQGTFFAARPEIRVGTPPFVNTGIITADREQLAAAELGLSVGSFLFQGEYMAAFVGDALLPSAAGRPRTRGDLFFNGFSMQASYFITGENRPYVRSEGIFGQVRPRRNFVRVRGGECEEPYFSGPGAWELAIRYSQVDLDNRGIDGGNLRDLTLGLNWYLNPQCRVLFNYILAWRDAANPRSDGFAQALGARFQLEF